MQQRPWATEAARDQARDQRNAMTPAEARLWQALRGRRLGVRFRRQVPLDRWILDFACLDPRIALEVDDTGHDLRDETERTHAIRAAGFTLLRFANRDIAHDLEFAIQDIRAEIARLATE